MWKGRVVFQIGTRKTVVVYDDVVVVVAKKRRKKGRETKTIFLVSRRTVSPCRTGRRWASPIASAFRLF